MKLFRGWNIKRGTDVAAYPYIFVHILENVVCSLGIAHSSRYFSRKLKLAETLLYQNTIESQCYKTPINPAFPRRSKKQLNPHLGRR